MRPTHSRAALATFALALVASMPAAAGVVYEIEVTDHGQSPPTSENIQASVEGRHLKMGVAGGQGRQGDMIFRGEKREMVVVDHDEKSFFVMDPDALRAIAGQLGGAMAQMQEALKNVPEGQRAAVEKMMKERMPQAAPKRPASELRKTSERSSQNGYPCVKYEVYRGGRKIREMWVTDWSNVEGGAEASDVFEDMADFFHEMMEALPNFGGGGGADDNVFEHLRDLNGFPVVTREFAEDGSLEGESSLRSASRRSIAPSEFEPPAGYKRQQMFP
jgi:hypothetical protein